MLFNYLSTPNDRREWVEAVRVARDILNQPAFAPFNDGELSPGPAVETDEEILDWVARGRRDRAAPLVHGEDGRSTTCRSTDPASMRVHGARGPPRRRRQRLPLRHQRQHLRAGDDGRREGRRPDPRQHPARPPSRCPTTATATTHRSTHRATAATDHDQARCGHDRNPSHDRPTPTASDAPERRRARRSTDLWKIFGPGADKIIGTPDADLSRAELKAKTGCVAGVKDVSFDVAPGRGLRGDGPVRLRQVDAGALPDPADRADGRHRRDRRRRRRPAPPSRSCATCAATTCRWCSSTSVCCRTGR